jgi:antitoxin component YwqK of YwqJK toxin-antitoxin module
MTEIPFIFTSLGTIYFLMRMEKQALPFKDYNFWLFFFFLIFGYYIRPTGTILIGGVIVYFLFERNWKMALIVIAGSIICAFPWYLRNISTGQHQVEKQIMLKNPYRPELGRTEAADWVARIKNNTKRYVSMEIPSALLGYKIEKYNEPLPKDKKWFIGLLFIALGIIGFFRLRELKWLIIAYMFGSFIVLIAVPEVWTGPRLMLTVIPIIYISIILAVFDGLSWLAKKINIQEKIRVSFLPFLFLFFIFVLKDGITYLEYSAGGDMPPMYARYFELARWAKTNIPQNSIVACRKPELFYLYSGCKTTGYLNSLNADSLISNLKTNKVTHVVLDQLGFASTGRYLYPAIQKNPEKFKLLQHLQNPDTYLFEVHYDFGYQGEMKDGKRNGKGISRNADGSVYEGYWKNDNREGDGTFTWANGLKFVGSFSNNLRNGPGIMYLGNGQILKATWIRDSIAGYAKLYDSKGKIIQEGVMKNNNFVHSK